MQHKLRLSIKSLPLTLSRYTELIKCLPYLDQAFETKKKNWRVDKKTNALFKNFHEKSFATEELKLSRADLFDQCKHNFHEALFSIIFWGYPRNMRGNNFNSILSSLDIIEETLSHKRNLSVADFTTMCNKLKNTGVGLSTLSKFLYFFEYTIEGHRCLILDKRIMDVINDENGFKELKELSLKDGINEFNKEKKYVVYLQVMVELSRSNGYLADQLEFFLFSMGMNLKQSKEPA